MDAITISKTTARRFVLGRQGLWPGRRWAGKAGTVEAVHAIEGVQLDPLNVVARSHDIALWGRIADYRPEYLDQALYQDRALFDYGGALFAYPISELPFWSVHMRARAREGRWATFAKEQPALLDEVRAELRARGPLGNRDFSGRARVNNYRGSKDTSVALYYLWLTGEVMVHHRRQFHRVYDFRERVAPDGLNYVATDEEAECFFARKGIASLGFVTESHWKRGFSSDLYRPIDVTEARRRLAALLKQGEIAALKVDGSKDCRYVLSEDLPLLACLEAGGVPSSWQTLTTTTEAEAVFLAPLDIVSARGRAGWLFDFEYIWEVYKPAAKRRWGYYTLPILYGDRLVGRLDPKLDREQATLRLNGFWLEDPALGSDPGFTEALARGLLHFTTFLGVERLDIALVEPRTLRAGIQDTIGTALDVQVGVEAERASQ